MFFVQNLEARTQAIASVVFVGAAARGADATEQAVVTYLVGAQFGLQGVTVPPRQVQRREGVRPPRGEASACAENDSEKLPVPWQLSEPCQWPRRGGGRDRGSAVRMALPGWSDPRAGWRHALDPSATY